MTLSLLLLLGLLAPTWAAYTEKEAAVLLETTGEHAMALWSAVCYASWDNAVNYSDATEAAVVAANKAYDDYQLEIQPEFEKYDWKNFSDPLIRRQFYFKRLLDEAALLTEDRLRRLEVLNEMASNYSSTHIKEYNSNNSEPTLYLEDIQVKIRDAEDPCEKAYYWDGWQTQSGRAVKTLYQEYVEFQNEMAVLNNFTDSAAYWQDDYETENLEAVLEKLAKDIEPLFLQLHSYIRRQLWLKYGQNNTVINPKGAIPASLLGNIWGLDGTNIFNITAPYPNKPSIDVSSELKAQNYTGLKMAKAAEAFYVSLNMSAMTDKFWEYSIFEKPADRDNIDCSDTGYTFYNGDDYRIKICAVQTLDDWGRVHHEMAHVENYMVWKDLPWLFQDAPNPAFNDLLGDTVYLFVTGPAHLKNVGLLDSSFVIDEEQVINALYYQALSIVFFLPYAYSLELWRWGVFKGEITPDNYNCEYWKIRSETQGVEPPLDRDESDFDPGAKHHIVASSHYILYFISGILQFQLHNALCEAAGEYDPNNSTSKPVYLCDIYNSTAAGEKLKSMMVLGRSYPWPDALEKVTGTRTLDVGPLLTYFQPLYEWLQAENNKTNEKLGWYSKNKRCYSKGETKPNSSGQCRYS